MQVGKLGFELHQRVVCTGNVARAAGTCAHRAGRLLHGRDHALMLAHAQIVVRAPDGNFTRFFTGAPQRARKRTDDPLEICEDAIAAFSVKLIDRF